MRDYFFGRYFKCQSDKHTLALIPAMHKSGSHRSCSVQLITDKTALCFDYPYEQFRKSKDDLDIRVAENYFGKDGIRFRLQSSTASASGRLEFGALSPIRYDIMGPFRFVPFMECRHSVISMRHTVNGSVRINGAEYNFHNALGYIEGDRGYSFPEEYAWTQCFFEGGSLMISVATIPFGAFRFTGIIGIIKLREKEYRLATYLGAKAVKIKGGEIIIKQGDTVFELKLIEKHAQPLRAPNAGVMNRIIHESAACRASYRLKQGGVTLLEFESPRASFEYEYR